MGDVKLSYRVLLSRFFGEETRVFFIKLLIHLYDIGHDRLLYVVGLSEDLTCYPLVNINKAEEDEYKLFFSALGALIVCAQSNSA